MPIFGRGHKNRRKIKTTHRRHFVKKTNNDDEGENHLNGGATKRKIGFDKSIANIK
jgi:hypothetical protein